MKQHTKPASQRQQYGKHTSTEGGFLQVPAFEGVSFTWGEELQRLAHTIKRQKYSMALTLLTILLLSLVTLEWLGTTPERNVAVSILLALSSSIIVSFIREGKDATINTREALARTLPLPLLGSAPVTNKDDGSYAFQTAQKPDSNVGIAFRALRNNVLLVTQKHQPKVISITSSDASEGKSSTSINLATAFAQAGQKVLLVDADLRRPTLHQHFGVDNIKGLGTYLANLTGLEKLIRPTAIEGIHLITSGPTTPHAVELLGNHRMAELVQQATDSGLGYDIVIFDSPPVLEMADALLISSRVQATLLVVACHQTRRSQVAAAFARLQQARVNVVGAVLTKVR